MAPAESLNMPNKSGKTPLHVAVSAGNMTAVNLLLANGGAPLRRLHFAWQYRSAGRSSRAEGSGECSKVQYSTEYQSTVKYCTVQYTTKSYCTLQYSTISIAAFNVVQTSMCLTYLQYSTEYST